MIAFKNPEFRVVTGFDVVTGYDDNAPISDSRKPIFKKCWKIRLAMPWKTRDDKKLKSFLFNEIKFVDFLKHRV